VKADQAITFLKTIPIFHEVSADELTRLAESGGERPFAAGDVLVPPHHQEAALLVVVQGECQAFIEHAGLGFEIELRRIYPGDYFGLEAAVTGAHSAACLRASTDGAALVLGKASLERLLENSLAFSRAVNRVLSSELQQTIREAHGIQFIRLQDFPDAKTVCRLLPPRISSMCRCLAVAQDGDRVTVAMVNPSDLKTRTFIHQALHDFRVQFVAVTDDDFERHGRRILGEILERSSVTANLERMRYQDPQGELWPVGGTSEENLLFEVLSVAVSRNASDVHFEPSEGSARVRLRIDGRMISLEREIPAATFRQLGTRIKVLSELDTTRIRRPQDGRFVVYLDDRRVEFRASVSPSYRGEKIVLRVVAPNAQMSELSNLILAPPLEQLARDLFESPSGLILVTGPSGAGKTTTLYAALNSIVAQDRGISIVTIEDPVEYDLPFATQFQVNRETGMDFANILRSVLRQDPDVLLVGEIRDRESAAMAAEAAMTGHLVLSSLHTYSALEAIIRLRDLNVEPYLIAAALHGVITQQLVPRLVPGCTEVVPPDDPIVQRLRQAGLWNGEVPGQLLRGCDTPGGPFGGEQGRVAIFEMLSITPALRAVIDASGSITDLTAALDPQSYSSFLDYAQFLLGEGLVAPERVAAVLPTGPTLLRAADHGAWQRSELAPDAALPITAFEAVHRAGDGDH
jgi:type II secretory ATPase GspE/PulE/Tfp pilus assembly ATPase PilB-like protein